MTQQPTADPFAPSPDKRTSVSFKDRPVGTTYVLEVAASPKLVQARVYETGDPAFWGDGNPKMTAVTDVVNTETGEEMSLWAPKPSALFAAIAEAQKTAGQTIVPGGRLTVQYTGDRANDNPKLNPAKQYAVTYTPPAPGHPADAFAAPAVSTPPPGWVVPNTSSISSQPRQVSEVSTTGPTAEQVAAVKAAGLDPAVVFANA